MGLRRRSEAGKPLEKTERRGNPPALRSGAQSPLRIPHDTINEVVVLAAIVTDPRAAKYLDSISADHFFGQGHAELWTALQEMRRRKLEYDSATVQQVSGGRANAEQLADYVRQRPQAPPNLRHHFEMLLWDATRIAAVKGPVAQFLEALRDPTADSDRVRSLAEKIPEVLKGHGMSRYLRTSANVVREQGVELAERRAGRAVYPYGIPGLDCYEVDGERAGAARMIPGAAPSKMTVVTGLSGSGKTTATAAMVLDHVNRQCPVLYGAWEQGAGNTLELLAARSLEWSRTNLMTGAFSAEEQRELEQEMERIGQYVHFFELPFGRALDEKRVYNERNLDFIHRHIAEVCPALFVADLFKYALTQTDPDDEEQALKRMLGMAQQEKCHVMLVQQLRLKDLETRTDNRPTRESVKGSGAWIEVPDTVIGWHRPALFKKIADDKIQCIVLKQRYGLWPIAVELDWDAEHGTITGGKSIEYDRPGEMNEVDTVLQESFTGRRGRGRKP